MKNFFSTIAFLMSFLWSVSILGQNPKPQIIPSLQHWQGGIGFFSIDDKTQLITTDEIATVVNQFKLDLLSQHKISLPVTTKKKQKNTIIFTLTNTPLPKEGYLINIEKKSVTVQANTSQGLFWATRTLLQMVQTKGKELPVGQIKDYPNYSHRGFMLDVGRKFFTIDFLRDYVKLLSYYKMNEFQIHLNDNGFKAFFDNDWDKTYAAFRLESETFPGLEAKDGYYTKKEFRELQELGQRYGVNVIPEIDIPAHSLAFSHYKPEIGSDKYGRDHLDLYKQETYDFVDALFKEYISADNPTFIGPDVHIGTDEYDKRESEKYREFTDRYLKYIQSLGKNVRMWGGLRWLKGTTPVTSNNVVVNAWSYDWIDPFESIKDGFKLISSPDSWLYIVPSAGYYRDFLDEKWLYQHWKPEMINYRETLPDGTPELLGGMFAVWNDHVGNGISQQDVHYRTLPAVKVLAQKMWNRTNPMPFKQFKILAQQMGDAPEINLSGNYPTDDNSIITSYFDTPFSFDNVIKTPFSDIGYDYRIHFDLNIKNVKENHKAILFSSDYSQVHLLKSENDYFQLGFQRDNYWYEFKTKITPEQWHSVSIEADYQSVTLYIDGQKEKLSAIKKEFKKPNGSVAHMYYQQTLMFPFKYIGKEGQMPKGQIKNLKIFKL